MATNGKTVRDVMSKRVATISLDDTIRDINAIFDQAKFHHLPVLDNDVLVGVISDRDVLRAVSPFLGTRAERTADLATLDRHAHQIMTRKLVTIGPDASLRSAAETMLKMRVSCLPVLEHSKLVGILTLKDVVKVLIASPADRAN